MFFLPMLIHCMWNKNKKLEKEHEKNGEEKKNQKPKKKRKKNLILSYANPTFLPMQPMPWDTLLVPYKKAKS
jgi:hypothetical protein